MKRIFLALILIIGFSNSSFAVFGGWVQDDNNDAGTVTSATKAFGSNTTAANFVIVAVRVGATGRTLTVTSAGLTFTQRANQVQTVDGHEDFIVDALNIPGGAATIQVAISGAAATLRWVQLEYGGSANTQFDKKASAEGNGLTLASGNATNAVAASFLFGFGSSSANTTFTNSAGYTSRESVPTTSGAERAGTEDQVVASIAAQNAGFGITASFDWGCILAIYNDAGGGGATCAPSLTLLGVGRCE